MANRDIDPLVPGRNVDLVDIKAGMSLAQAFGYSDAERQMVVEYALMRHGRGEEEGAQKSALSGGIDLTSWYAILAAARAATTISEENKTVRTYKVTFSVPGEVIVYIDHEGEDEFDAEDEAADIAWKAADGLLNVHMAHGSQSHGGRAVLSASLDGIGADTVTEVEARRGA